VAEAIVARAPSKSMAGRRPTSAGSYVFEVNHFAVCDPVPSCRPVRDDQQPGADLKPTQALLFGEMEMAKKIRAASRT
jgi:hypothetical protein